MSGHDAITVPLSQNSNKRVQEVRYSNTLHGFNPFTNRESHIVGLVYKYSPPNLLVRDTEITYEDRKRYQECICAKLNLDTSELWFDTSYGGEYLEVQFTSRHKIPEIVNECLEIGLCIKLQTRLQSFYKPGEGPFSLEKSEQLGLLQLETSLTLYPFIIESKADCLGDERLWKTERGKAFARRVQAKFPDADCDVPLYLPPSSIDDPTIDFPLAQPQTEAVQPTLIPCVALPLSCPAPEIEKSPSTQETCMICLDLPADTMVLPCLDVVVCRACSQGLRQTPDNKICVKCRRPITKVVWDGGEENK